MQPRRANAVSPPDRPYRYQELADFITRLVAGGTLLPGSRVPSLRQISHERGTSLATALQAYRLLEDRGVLEARPQSGYYVARSAHVRFEAPAISKAPSTPSDERKRELLRILTRHRVPLIEDDIYGDVYFGERRSTPFSALDPAADVIYCNSFSKTVAPGYRMGWMTPARHMPRVLERKMTSTLSGVPLVQCAFADYLASGGYDRHLRRMRGVFRDNIERMSQAISRSFPPGTRVSRPSGGYVLWVELPRRVDTRELFDLALERGICFAPGDVFSATRRYGHCLRLSCGARWSVRIERALETLGRMAREALDGRPAR